MFTSRARDVLLLNVIDRNYKRVPRFLSRRLGVCCIFLRFKRVEKSFLSIRRRPEHVASEPPVFCNHVCLAGSFERDEREWLCYKLARTPQWIESRLQLDLLQKQVLSSVQQIVASVNRPVTLCDGISRQAHIGLVICCGPLFSPTLAGYLCPG